ncbi:MAG: NAD-dependent epimerase/dehydratase family protein [Oscillospiraceae bacterium]|jgi:dihydroflavonol-4-reductase
MNRLFLVTGANGHLGNTIIRMLKKSGAAVRGLILPNEQGVDGDGVRYFHGDVRKVESLRPLFEQTGDAEVYVIHTAGIIDISEQVSPLMYDVNVNGTKNILALCMEYKVKRLLYVSSVHAIPEQDQLAVLHEVKRFSPDWVVGGYAKTKAEATQAVLDAAEQGLDAVVVHPSGILGPYDSSGNHLVQLVRDYINGKLPACVHGGYDFVDVRDVASGCLTAMEKGKTGECYILSNRHYEVKDVLRIAKNVTGGRKLPVLPMWMAKTAAPLMGLYSKLRKERPLYTKYSLYTLSSNDRFSHDKATVDLNYRPRDLRQTIADTVTWLREITPPKKKTRQEHRAHKPLRIKKAGQAI